MGKKKKEAEKARKKALDAHKKKVAELQAKKEAEKKAKEAAEAGENAESKTEEEKKEEEKAPEPEEPAEDDVEMVEPEDPEPVMGEPPKVTLTDEDKKIKFRTTATPDITPQVFNTSFQKFSLPSKDEGFDDFRYEWSPAGECESYVKQYILAKKNTTRVEDIKPSPWFKEKK